MAGWLYKVTARALRQPEWNVLNVGIVPTHVPGGAIASIG
jgi:hypothetical protein